MQVRTGSKLRRPSAPREKGARGTGLFGFMNHGGRRRGGGRKAALRPDGKRVYNRHTTRESFGWSRPVHVTVRVRAGLPSLRGEALSGVVLRCLEAGNERVGFRLVHFSVQTNHIHMICEAAGPAELSAALKGLNVRIARAINKQLRLKGRVIEDRYHMEVLRSPTQARNAVRYVLRNGEKHGVHVAARHGGASPCPDPLSSAAWYPYWKESELLVLATQSPASVVRPARSFLLGEGLRGMERLSLHDAPPVPARAKMRVAEARPARRRAARDSSARAPA